MKKQFLFFIFLILLGVVFCTNKAFAGIATVSWNANTEPDLAGYKIYYGISPRSGACPTGGYPNVQSVGIVTTYTFNSLTNGLTYYFSVTAYDTSNNESTCSAEVSKIIPAADTTPPTISLVAASSITSSGATIAWTTNEASDSQVEYGLTASYGSQTTLNSSMVTSHSQALSGLSASTLYHYRVKSKDASSNLATSGDNTFTTSAAVDTTPPVRSAGTPSGSLAAGTTQAILSLTTNENATCRYSTTAGVAYSSMTNTFSITGGVSHSATITGLTNGASYNYYVRCQDSAGNVNIDDYQIGFSVALPADTTPPTISGAAAGSVNYNSATITWTTNENSDSQVEYGLTISYGSQSALNSSMVTSHSVLLSGLSASAVYHYRVKSRDAAGNLATSGDYTFTTTATPTFSVSLSANPNSGTAPLNSVDLSATVSGSVSGNTNYTFYCDRSDTGVNITTPNQGKYDNQSATTYNAVDICSYPAAGTYTAKVIVERGGYQAEARVPITVSEQNYAPIGNVDGADTTHVTGWAYDQNVGVSAITVHIYIDGVHTGTVTANLARNDIVGAGGGVVQDANHGFDYTFSSLSAGSHVINVYAINTPTGTNPELTGSPKTITVSASTPTPTPTPTPTSAPTPAPSPGPYPNGSVVTVAGSEKIYLIVNNEKRWISDPGVFVSYGLVSGSQQTISQADLDKYPTGPDITQPSYPFGTLIRAKGDFKVYIIKGIYKRHIFNPAIFNMYGHFTWASIKDVEPSVVSSYVTSDLYRADGDTRVYSLEEVNEVAGTAIKHHLNMTPDQFVSKGYSWSQIFIVNAKERDYYQTGTDFTY